MAKPRIKLHACQKNSYCARMLKLGALKLCGQKKSKCRFFAPLAFGRYDLEDILLP